MSTEIDYTERHMTAGYLIKDGTILLVEKGRNIGMGKLVGVGGKQEDGETIEETARREIEEEIKVKVTKMRKAAEMEFVFPHNPKYGGLVTGYIVEEWEGEPQITEEAKSIDWYDFNNLPTERMWHDNTIWVPLILSGKNVKGRFVIGEDDRVTEYELQEIDNWGDTTLQKE
jgi:8-oxo-dGTP diphosphatase